MPKLGDLKVGDLFQFKRGGRPTIWEADGRGGYRQAGLYVAGVPHLWLTIDRGAFCPPSHPERETRAVDVAVDEA